MTSQASLFDLPAPPEPKANPVKRERDRITAAAMRVLHRLQEGPATNVELSAPDCGGLAGVRRTWDLRKQGWDITKEHLSGGVWRYTLHGLKR